MAPFSASVAPGDILRIERRYVLNGALTSQIDTGRFRGIEVIGSAEHLVLQESGRKKLRLFPLSSISEITLVRAAPRAQAGDVSPAPRDDPAFC